VLPNPSLSCPSPQTLDVTLPSGIQELPFGGRLGPMFGTMAGLGVGDKPLLPTVSVVIPSFNRAAAVERALRSVLAQTYTDLEAIIVDDCSTDNTSSVVDLCRSDDSRTRYLRHDSRKGAQAARNTGIRAARGGWIAFLDSDDKWFPDSLDVRLRRARERHLQVVHSGCTFLRPGSTRPEPYEMPHMEGRMYAEVLKRPGPMFQALLVSREAMARIGELDESIAAYQEWDTSIRLARYCEFGFVPEPTFLYDCSGDDTISKDQTRDARGYEQVVRKHWRSILRYAGFSALSGHFAIVAGSYRRANDVRNANRCRWTAFALQPHLTRSSLSWLVKTGSRVTRL